ncbi:hypothetical protein ZOSMA_322G00030 [Zostera marina]|uniref:Pentatricopeptide repeat-containing protein n=1 Tax=Zostera marina TaxID=29655 RepID=A0A0K9PAW4_ZOSMR|nr:hypothetical protein ZOSMA_322G00030 [Zostera marina]
MVPTKAKNAFIFSCALVSCCGLRCRWGGKQVDGLATKRGLVGNYRSIYIDNLLMDLYASTSSDDGRVDRDACFVFEEMLVKTEDTWTTTMMIGYTRSGDFHAGIQLFRRMLREEGLPERMLLLTPFTCSVAIQACSSTAPCLCGEIHGGVPKFRVSNCLLDGYVQSLSELQ